MSIINRIKAFIRDRNPEDLRGDISASEACDYVRNQSTDFDTYKPLQAAPHIEHGQCVWEVQTVHNSNHITWQVWSVSVGDYGYDSTTPGIYGEW